LQSTAEDPGTKGRDNVYGHGLVRADRAYLNLSRICPYSNQMHVELLFKTNANSNENKILLRNLTKNRTVWHIKNIPQSTTVSYGKCVLKRSCYRIILKDSGSNGLNDGFFSVSVDGVLIQSTRFRKGKVWRSSVFGRC
jgi:hypothetical protein